MAEIGQVQSPLDLAQAQDLRRSVLCGELHLSREAVDDALDGEASVFLLREGTKPVATARLLKRGADWMAELLVVLPAQRRRGMGRALLECLAERARGQGATALKAVAPAPAQPFFQACGYQALAAEGELTLYQKPL